MVSLRSLFASVAVMAAAVSAAVTPQQIADAITNMNTQHQNMQAPAESISIINSPLIIIGQGPFPEIIKGYTEIIQIANTLLTKWDTVLDITGDDAELVYTAYKEHVRIGQTVLSILIKKAELVHKIPFIGPPIAQVLRVYEGVFDTISVKLIEQMDPRANDVQTQANNYGETVDLAINKYQPMA